ncbi:RNA polymerase sigma factor [Eubacteriales bacterium OttesenSCG-928-K08]|nr:RNA polymerase sigma factor [Eubacteriales bacterium OttesenSCG-928-K08]
MSDHNPLTKAEFSKAIQENAGLLFTVSFAIVKDRQLSADAVQCALLKAWEKRKSLREHASFKSWLVRIVINESKNALRRPPNIEFKEYYAPITQNEQQKIDVRKAVYALPIKYRLPVALFYFEGYSVDETAHLLNMPPNTISSRLFRARNLLRKELKDYETDY